MWFLGFRSAIKPRDEWNVSLEEHLAWIKEMHEAGKIVISGPGKDHTLGVYLIRAETLEEAAEIAEADPFTVGGNCEFELMDWDIHQILGIGSFTHTGPKID
jgi:uncharacterized protein YciI